MSKIFRIPKDPVDGYRVSGFVALGDTVKRWSATFFFSKRYEELYPNRGSGAPIVHTWMINHPLSSGRVCGWRNILNFISTDKSYPMFVERDDAVAHIRRRLNADIQRHRDAIVELNDKLHSLSNT